MIRKMIALLFISLSFSIAHVCAAEHWRAYDPQSVPWEKALSMTSFNGRLLVSGKAKGESFDNFWHSEDGRSWMTGTLPPLILNDGRRPNYIARFCEFKGALYGFEVAITSATRNSTNIRVFRSTDGLAWEPADNGEFYLNPGVWTDVVVHEDMLYAANSRGEIWRSNGVATPPVWSLMLPASQHIQVSFQMSFAVFKGDLYWAAGQLAGSLSLTEIYHMSLYPHWSRLGFIAFGDVYRPGTVVHEGKLYWAANSLRSLGSNSNPHVEWPKTDVGPLPVPFLIDGVLHAFNLAGQISAHTDGRWEQVSDPIQSFCATSSPQFEKAVEYKNMVFLLPCDLLVLEKGFYAATASESFVGSLTAGEKNVPVLSFTLKVNLREAIKKLRVANHGEAIAGRDIEKLVLYRQADFKRPEEIFAELVWDDVDQTWTTPPNFRLPVEDGDRFSLIVDVAKEAVDGTTFRPAIGFNGNEGFMWEVNTAPRTPARLTLLQSITIRNTAVPPVEEVVTTLEGVVVAPMPAQNETRFYYSIGTPADVMIDIYDRGGIRVASLNEPNKAPDARASTRWDCSSVAPGVYVAIIRINESAGPGRTYKSKLVVER